MQRGEPGRSGSGYLPGAPPGPGPAPAVAHAVGMRACNASNAEQAWSWNGDGAVQNARGRCLTLQASGVIRSEACQTDSKGAPAASQVFTAKQSDNSTAAAAAAAAAMEAGHGGPWWEPAANCTGGPVQITPRLAKPGYCLDMNANSDGGPIVDTYECCCSACCCNCELWTFKPSGSGATSVGTLVSSENQMCVTEDPPQVAAYGGSYVTLVSFASHQAEAASAEAEGAGTAAGISDVTVVIETMDNGKSTCSYGNSGWSGVAVGANTTNTQQFCFVGGGLCSRGSGAMQLWRTSALEGIRFEKQPPVHLDVQCCAALALAPNSLYTLTTVTSGAKGIQPARPGGNDGVASRITNHASRIIHHASRITPLVACPSATNNHTTTNHRQPRAEKHPPHHRHQL
jgi:hypothetical protein